MLKKEITYVDYNGVERKETYYFNLTKTELMKTFGTGDGTVEILQGIIDAKDGRALMDNFDKLILSAYGEKDADGIHFRKSDAISEAFSQTPAYDILFMELLNDEKAAAEFVNHILPADLVAQANSAVLTPTIASAT